MILLTGGSGQVGRSLLAHAHINTLPVFAPTRAELDLSDSQSIARSLASRPWSAIINAGAYTAVDQAENEPALADAINAKAPALLADYCKAQMIPMVHFSTDYVFSGDKPSAYSETDDRAPLGVYGQTKCDGEQAVLASGCKAVVLRTAWVVSPYGKNFVKTMLRLAQQRDAIRVVADQYGCPTGATDLADGVMSILPRLMQDSSAPQGLYHCSNRGDTTWAGLARAVMAASARLGGPIATIIDITTADYPTPAKRPQNSRLSCEKLQREWGIKMRPWQDMIADTVAVLLPEKGSAS